MPGLSFVEARFPWSRKRSDTVAGPERRKQEKAIGTRRTLFGARIFERCGTYALLSLSAYVGLHPALSAGGFFRSAWIRFYLSIRKDAGKDESSVALKSAACLKRFQCCSPQATRRGAGMVRTDVTVDFVSHYCWRSPNHHAGKG
jgi:hypothetical protein